MRNMKRFRALFPRNIHTFRRFSSRLSNFRINRHTPDNTCFNNNNTSNAYNNFNYFNNNLSYPCGAVPCNHRYYNKHFKNIHLQHKLITK